MGTTAYIGLGSNLGDRKAHLDFAVASLGETPGITVAGVSTFRETRPVGGPVGQSAFLNAAVALDTTLDPDSLHRRLQAIEDHAGRVRFVRWGERTLDLDLLLFGDRSVDTPTLTVPHSRLALRRFVLEPLYELAPSAVDPATGNTISVLLHNLDRRPSFVALPGWWKNPPLWSSLTRLVDRLGAFPIRASEAETLFSNVLPGMNPRDTLVACRWLVLEAWNRNRIGDQWLVSDFLPETWFPEPPLLKPTFIVRFEHDDGRESAPCFDRVPVLRLKRDDPEAVLREILATCEGTRTS